MDRFLIDTVAAIDFGPCFGLLFSPSMASLPLLLFLVFCPSYAQTQVPSPVKVNIVMILVDDLGYAGIEANNPYVLGPRVTELKHQGLYLSRHYVYKFCSPTRGSFLSGRYPYRLGNTRSNFIPWSRPDGLNTNFETLPLRLKSRGYSTHHVVGAVDGRVVLVCEISKHSRFLPCLHVTVHANEVWPLFTP